MNHEHTNPRASFENIPSTKNLRVFSPGEDARGAVVVHLPWPPSVNRIWRQGKRKGSVYLDLKYKAWRKEADKMVMAQRRSIGRMVEGHFTAVIVLDERKRWTKHGRLKKIDGDNRKKAVLDCLERMRVIDGDHLSDKSSVEWGPVDGVRVTITEAQGGQA